ncbi:hypothetical protein COLO4_35872 [Corchorus olitorius]|uniref:Uncharacterized protein n=1 Tax=Corchorus olitorius TaxID=93759 RepID=A0A1R3GCP0_9ROSI|nr:hypothetical protein COLO4_35872 [Corchorus olitorius]
MDEPPNSGVPYLETTRTKTAYQFETDTSKSLHPRTNHNPRKLDKEEGKSNEL